MNDCHWVYPLPAPADWRCPKCNKAVVYGCRRSFWSLLPFVCIHRIQRWDEYLIIHPGIAELNLAYLDVGKTVPVKETGIAGWFRGRLKDELHGNRRYWWMPYTNAYKEMKESWDIPLSNI